MDHEKSLGETFLASLNQVKKNLLHIMSKQRVDGLRQSEFFMLMRIANHCKEQEHEHLKSGTALLPGVRISTLSKATNSSMPGVSQMINALENAGYVERITTKKDRRVVYVNVTEAGRVLLETAPRPMLTLLTRTTEEMGEEKTRQFIALMDEFSETIERLNAENNETGVRH
ncbi:MarR family transcriptional regulator [Eubacterium sp. 1001713B170207_170306_E7]|uniref:MarR family winged helix-turn-helix transcriptional regulator n=1 Tax=Eubacterium sp. 1001713B170207_170306_E7 TaxID=2787097 RepID=UPI001FAE4204|nr:MarR family transcriptional regulator [Eubacterium sp. 1001713B170207_170306_E7]